MGEYYQKNKEEILRKRKEYRDKNPEKVKECKRLSRLNHLEKNKQRDKDYYQKNTEQVKSRAGIYYQKNKDKIRLKNKQNRTELSKKAIKNYHSNPDRKKKTIMRSALNKEFERGNVKKEKCGICGVTENLEFHHEDYNNPKKYKFLCKRHHLEEHKNIKQNPKMESIFE